MRMWLGDYLPGFIRGRWTATPHNSGQGGQLNGGQLNGGQLNGGQLNVQQDEMEWRTSVEGFLKRMLVRTVVREYRRDSRFGEWAAQLASVLRQWWGDRPLQPDVGLQSGLAFMRVVTAHGQSETVGEIGRMFCAMDLRDIERFLRWDELPDLSVSDGDRQEVAEVEMAEVDSDNEDDDEESTDADSDDEGSDEVDSVDVDEEEEVVVDDEESDEVHSIDLDNEDEEEEEVDSEVYSQNSEEDNVSSARLLCVITYNPNNIQQASGSPE
jgi:hypothetical protein